MAGQAEGTCERFGCELRSMPQNQGHNKLTGVGLLNCMPIFPALATSTPCSASCRPVLEQPHSQPTRPCTPPPPPPAHPPDAIDPRLLMLPAAIDPRPPAEGKGRVRQSRDVNQGRGGCVEVCESSMQVPQGGERCGRALRQHGGVQEERCRGVLRQHAGVEQCGGKLGIGGGAAQAGAGMGAAAGMGAGGGCGGVPARQNARMHADSTPLVNKAGCCTAELQAC